MANKAIILGEKSRKDAATSAFGAFPATLTHASFDAWLAPFIAQADDDDADDYNETDRERIRDVLTKLETYLFAEEDARLARYQQYLRLKLEFEVTDTGTGPAVSADWLGRPDKTAKAETTKKLKK